MPVLKDKAFDAFVVVVESNLAWSRGVTYEWEGQAVAEADFIEDLVRLAFEAPARYRKEFSEKWGA